MFYKYLSKIPAYQKYINNKILAQSKFYQSNRTSVLITYRHFLKLIPKIYPRTLQQAQKINEIRWIYKSSKQLPNIYQTQGRTKFAVEILEDLKKGDYSRLGDLVPFRLYNHTESMNNFVHQNSPKKKKWWQGYVH